MWMPLISTLRLDFFDSIVNSMTSVPQLLTPQVSDSKFEQKNPRLLLFCFPAFLAFLVLFVRAFADSTRTCSRPIQNCLFGFDCQALLVHSSIQSSTFFFSLFLHPVQFYCHCSLEMSVCFIMNKCLSFAFFGGLFLGVYC